VSYRTCKTCRWVGEPGSLSKCNAPQNLRTSVDRVGYGPGPADRRYDFCSTQRDGGWLDAAMSFLTQLTCGPQGQWWRPRDDAKGDV
jgi:hypothetical protein